MYGRVVVKNKQRTKLRDSTVVIESYLTEKGNPSGEKIICVELRGQRLFGVASILDLFRQQAGVGVVPHRTYYALGFRS